MILALIGVSILITVQRCLLFELNDEELGLDFRAGQPDQPACCLNKIELSAHGNYLFLSQFPDFI